MAREPELTEFRLKQLEAGASEPAATTTTPGEVVLDSASPQVVSTTTAAAGTTGKAADSGHVHVLAPATTSAPGAMPAANFAALAPPVASIAALQAIAAASRADGMVVLVTSDTTGAASHWRFSASSTASDASNNLVVTPSAGTGRWLLMPGSVTLLLPFTFATADNATLFTMPTGAKLKVREAWWEIAADMTGGTASAVGAHASPSGWSTKGDVLGGAAGDVAATLVASATRMVGTIGTKVATLANGRLLMIAADTINFDRIVSAFTAGSGNVRVLCDLVANPGA